MQKRESGGDTQPIPARIRHFPGGVPKPPTCWGIKLRKALRLLAILSGAGSKKYTPICLLCGGNRLPPHRGGQRTPKLFLRRIWRKDSFGVRRNKGGGAAGVLFSVRDVDVLRLLCWCQNIRPQDLNSISTKAERENLMALGFIKLHERSGTLTLTGSGRALLELIFNGAIPSLSLSYHGAAIERRIRISRLMLSAYRAGIDVFAPEVNVAREIPSLFLTSITRTRGRNSWGSSRVAAILSLGGIYYAAHYVCPGIGRMAVNDELTAFHNHTNFGKNTQRAFLFAGSSYESVIEELKTQDEKRNEKLIRYGEAYHCLHAPIHLLSCDETGAQQLQIMTVIAYISKRAELTFSQLKMNRVEISLYDVVKSTGEVKDTFKFQYGGRRYDRLSLSEKIRAGMEVSELMKRLTGRNYPVFVDNMESVDDLANVRPTGQIIMAKCVSGAALQVKPIRPIAFAEQRAA